MSKTALSIILVVVALSLGWTLRGNAAPATDRILAQASAADAPLLAQLHEIADQRRALDRELAERHVRDSVLTVEAQRANARADAYAARWRAAVAQAPVDTAAAYVALQATGDSLERACTDAASACKIALAAKDATIQAQGAALVLADSVTAVKDQRIDVLTSTRDKLTGELRKRERWSKLRTLRDAGIGGGIVYLILSLAGR